MNQKQQLHAVSQQQQPNQQQRRLLPGMLIQRTPVSPDGSNSSISNSNDTTPVNIPDSASSIKDWNTYCCISSPFQQYPDDRCSNDDDTTSTKEENTLFTIPYFNFI